MATITYREPTVEDIPALAELGRTTFVSKFGHLYDPADLADFLATAYAHDNLTRQLTSGRVLFRVAEDGPKMVAFVKVGLDVSLDWSPPPGRTAVELKQLYVLDGYQGHGIGDALMRWVFDLPPVRAADDMVLSVWSENFGAQRFYARYGFAWVADSFFMVGKHRDEEFLYAKKLKE